MTNFESLIETQDRWKNETDYLVLLKQTNLPSGLTIDKEVIAVKCSKRGNDVYVRRILDRLEGLENIEKLSTKGEVYGLFLTLTTDPSKYELSKIEAWEDISEKWNRLNSWIRKKYDSFIGFFRVYESTKKGYPHIHAILFFDRKVFIPQDKLQRLWKAFVWIKPCRNVKGSINYLVKYLHKGFTERSHAITPSMLWVFHKQSFGVSNAIFHLIQATMHNSNFIQMNLFGEVAYDIEIIVIGIFSDYELREKSGGLIETGYGNYIVSGWDFD